MNKIQSVEGLDEATIKRRAYARSYYAAHRDTMLAAVRRSQAKRAAAKHAIKTAETPPANS